MLDVGCWILDIGFRMSHAVLILLLSRLSGFLNSWIPGFLDSWIPEFLDSWIPEFLNS
jgi:hypothetical protein